MKKYKMKYTEIQTDYITVNNMIKHEHKK